MHYIYLSFCQSYLPPCQIRLWGGVRADGWGESGGRWEIVPYLEPFLQQRRRIGNVIYNLERGERARDREENNNSNNNNNDNRSLVLILVIHLLSLLLLSFFTVF